jgi:2-polyprenyl-6-methoxyphenol hydroxylase-like FAD-dependent oxidoreductase
MVGRGPVTLLGDAAHPTTPNLGQGACQALDDAIVLAHCLSGTRPIEAALRKYAGLRLPRTTGRSQFLANRESDATRLPRLGIGP